MKQRLEQPGTFKFLTKFKIFSWTCIYINSSGHQ